MWFGGAVDCSDVRLRSRKYSGFTVIQFREMQASTASASERPHAAASLRNRRAACPVSCPFFARRCLTMASTRSASRSAHSALNSAKSFARARLPPTSEPIGSGEGVISLGGVGDFSLGETSGVTVTLVTLLSLFCDALRRARNRACRSALVDRVPISAFTAAAICSAVQPAATIASRTSGLIAMLGRHPRLERNPELA